MSRYVANGTMYGAARCYSNPFGSMKTEPFKTSIKELYRFMLQRCLDRTKKYDNTNDWDSLDFAMLRHMQREIDETNPLRVVLSDGTYYFNDSKEIWRIDKYESS